jgi:hypothetical protein
MGKKSLLDRMHEPSLLTRMSRPGSQKERRWGPEEEPNRPRYHGGYGHGR